MKDTVGRSVSAAKAFGACVTAEAKTIKQDATVRIILLSFFTESNVRRKSFKEFRRRALEVCHLDASMYHNQKKTLTNPGTYISSIAGSEYNRIAPSMRQLIHWPVIGWQAMRKIFFIKAVKTLAPAKSLLIQRSE
jgi:hypothetical protein